MDSRERLAVQQEVLREGELFLDAFLGPRKSILFCVTRSECRAVRLPGVDGAFGNKIGLYHELLSAPPDEGGSPAQMEVIEAAGRSLSRMILGEVGDRLQDADRIIVASDSRLNLVPLSALYSPGSAPLHESHELVRVLEVFNIITNGQMIMEACRARKASNSSLGFTRSDYPEVNPPEWQKWVTVRQDQGRVSVGELALDYQGDLEKNYAEHSLKR